MLPQVHSALKGVEKLGELIEKYGSSEGFGVSFADSEGCWYLENVASRHWVAQRIPEDCYFFSANQMRLPGKAENAADAKTSTEGVYEFAVRVGYTGTREDFNCAEFFRRDIQDPTGKAATDTTYNKVRVERVLSLLPGEGELFVRPAAKLTLADFKRVFRDHYDGTKDDLYLRNKPCKPNSKRAIDIIRTTNTHIIQINPAWPKALEGIAIVDYVALGMPGLSVFMPFYKGLGDNIPSEYTEAFIDDDGNVVNENTIFWLSRKRRSW